MLKTFQFLQRRITPKLSSLPGYGFYIFLIAESIGRNLKVKTTLGTISGANVLLILLFFFVVYRYLANPKSFFVYIHRRSLAFSFGLVLLFYFTSFFSLLNPVDLSASLRYSVTFTGLVILFFTVFFVVDKKEIIRGTQVVLVLTGVFLTLLTISQALGFRPTIFGSVEMGYRREIAGVPMPFWRTIGIFHTYGSYGLWLFPTIGVSVVNLFGLIKTKIHKWVFLLVLLLVLFGLFISQSRAVWLGVFVTTVVAGLGGFWVSFARKGILCRFSRKEKLVASISVLVGLAVIVVLLGFLFPKVVLAPYHTLINISETSWTARVNLNAKALELFKTHPFLGVGAGAVRHFLPNVLHNTTLFVLSSYGLLGFVPFVLLIFHTIWLYIAVIVDGADEFLRTSALVFFSSFAGMLITVQFFLGLHDKIFWVAIAMGHSLYLINYKRKTDALAQSGES